MNRSLFTVKNSRTVVFFLSVPGSTLDRSTASLRSAPPIASLCSAPVPPLNVPRVAVVELAKVLPGATACLKPQRYLRKSIVAANRRPAYWAATVPHAIPTNPNPWKAVPLIPSASKMLAMMFTPLTVTSVSIELKLSCIPMNQPLNVIRHKVAGAAQILM